MTDAERIKRLVRWLNGWTKYQHVYIGEWNPFDNIADAWELVDGARSKGYWDFNLGSLYDGMWKASIAGNSGICYVVVAPTASLAICGQWKS